MASPGRQPAGLLARQRIAALVASGGVGAAAPIEPGQIQPASLDLRLGPEAFRVRASFLPGKGASVVERLKSLNPERVSLAGDGAVLEKGIVYVAPLMERLRLPASVSGAANPKSSTGRLDIFTRLIVDGSDAFDACAGRLCRAALRRNFAAQFQRPGARRHAPEPAALSRPRRGCDPRRRGSSARATRPHRSSTARSRCATASSSTSGLPASRAKSSAIARSRTPTSSTSTASAPMRRRISGSRILARPDRRLVLDPDEFYILASREKMQIPADLAAEMAPIDPAIGEFRVHYAGFFDPGFGQGADGKPAARAVLEVRSRDVPFLIEDGQPVGRLVYEELADAADELYGAGADVQLSAPGTETVEALPGVERTRWSSSPRRNRPSILGWLVALLLAITGSWRQR